MNDPRDRTMAAKKTKSVKNWDKETWQYRAFKYLPKKYHRDKAKGNV